jgi:haloalkane dehalogenase
MNAIASRDPWPRRVVPVLDSWMSFVATGSGAPLVFLHGNPTSAHLWRNIIAHVRDLRLCLAPDLIGMGRSGDSPGGPCRFGEHARYLDAWFDLVLPREPVVLVLHDWGSALGFHWARRHPERVAAIAYMESLVQPRRWSDFPAPRAALFQRLRSEEGARLIREENFFVETVVPKSVLRQLGEEEMQAYRAPFLDPDRRLTTLSWARELPIEGEPADVAAEVEAYGRWLATSSIPKLFINAEPGALLTGRAREFCRTWPNQQEVTVHGIHYVQEDSPEEIGRALRGFLALTRESSDS